jgi:hypothetical protein
MLFYRNQQVQAKSYKEFIPVKSNKEIYFLKVAEIVYVQADYGVVFAFDSSNKRHALNQASLKEIQDMISPDVFFKINRSELINRNYIEKISRYAKNTVAIHTQFETLKTSQNTLLVRSISGWGYRYKCKVFRARGMRRKSIRYLCIKADIHKMKCVTTKNNNLN